MVLKVPPLPDKMLGARLTDRVIPIATFEAWKTHERDLIGRSDTNDVHSGVAKLIKPPKTKP